MFHLLVDPETSLHLLEEQHAAELFVDVVLYRMLAGEWATRRSS